MSTLCPFLISLISIFHWCLITSQISITLEPKKITIKGMKPRMKNHFRAHQISIWLRLIPELHRAGMEDVIARHNLFKNHDDMELYDGSVKLDSLSRLTFLEETFKQRRTNASLGEFGLMNGKSRSITISY